MSTGKIELSVGAVKYVDPNEIITEEEYNYIRNKVPELDGRVGVIEDEIDTINNEIEEINSSLEHIANFSTNKMSEKQTILLSKFYQKLMKKQNIKIICQGDSMTYGHDLNSSDKRGAETTLTDNGTKHVETRASKSYPEALQEYLNNIYGTSSIIINKGYSGDNVETGLEHWIKNDNADLAIIMYGINDSQHFENTDRYIIGLRKIVERYLKWGTPVILLTAPRVKNQEDPETITSNRYTEPFRHATFLVGDEYGCPVIDSELFMNGCDNTYYSDTTHYNGKGYTYFASRLVSILIGYGEKNKVELQGGSTLSVRSTRDNFINYGVDLNSSSGSSGAEEWLSGEGILATFPPNSSLTYGFETKEDNLILIPCYVVNSGSICDIKLDFGKEQGSAPLLGSVNMEIPQGTKPLSRIISSESTITAGNNKPVFDGSINLNTTNKFLWITNKGWHNIEISNTGTANFHFQGFVCLSFKDFISQKSTLKNDTFDAIPIIGATTTKGNHTYSSTTSGKIRVINSNDIVVGQMYIYATIDNTIDGDVYIDLPPNIPSPVVNCACAMSSVQGLNDLVSAHIVWNTRRILFTKTNISDGTRNNLKGTDIRGKILSFNLTFNYMI